jgi:hypothetical protein
LPNALRSGLSAVEGLKGAEQMPPDDGSEIEREERRRKFRNFVIFIALALGVTIAAIEAINSWRGR